MLPVWLLSPCFFALFATSQSTVRGQGTESKLEIEGSIQRLNYGVVFEKQSPIYLSREYWMHPFEIELPNNITINAIHLCKPPLQNCYIFNTITSHVNVAKENTMSFVKNTLKEFITWYWNQT